MPATSDTTAALRRVTEALPAGESRPGQVQMAEAVAATIQAGSTLLVQAGTGTGKSLGYLVPAVLSGHRTVVATATKALQDQLAEHDLPLLAEHLGIDVSFTVLKGRSNYACRQRLAELERGGEQLALDGMAAAASAQELAALAAWAERSPTGDRAELEREPSVAAWAAVSVGPRECPGRGRCPSASTCFTELARDRAADSDVIVVNQHLYGMHLASDGAVLPEHDVLIVDEAHQLEDTLSATISTEVSPGRFGHLARAIGAILAEPELTDGVARLEAALTDALVPLLERRLRRPDPTLTEVLVRAGEQLATALGALRGISTEDLDAQARRDRAVQATGALAEDVHSATNVRPNEVAWVEGTEQRPVLRVAPLDVGEALGDVLTEDVSLVLTSATLPRNLAVRLGLDEHTDDVLDVGSPFDYEAQGLLYCAASLPDPRSSGFDDAAIEELRLLIDAAGGRTLALFTSWRMLRAAADALRGELPGPLLCQDELAKPALLRAFTEDHASSLFATMGFWQGIDVPGPSLSLVVIDRIPFPRPDEPLLAARREIARGEAFATIDLPIAATMLAQGAGRLIRSTTDRGVVAVLDPRLATATYRWALVRALPPLRRTKERAEVLTFLQNLPNTCSREGK